MKVVMTQAVCPEGMRLLDGLAEVYVADNPDPNNYLSQMQDADALIVRGCRRGDPARHTRRDYPWLQQPQCRRTRGRDDVQPFQESL